MADIDNGHGEIMPDEYQIAVDNPPILFAPDMKMQQTDGDGHNTAQPSSPVFVYFDVGRWGGDLPDGQRCFGLIWGRWAALCEFLPGGGPKAVINDGNSPLDSLLDLLQSPDHHVLVRKSLWSPAPVAEPDLKAVWVVIGDLHLPVRIRATQPSILTDPAPPLGVWGVDKVLNPENRDGRQFFKPEDAKSVRDWYDKYWASDIFKSAANDLVQFLQLLDQGGLPGNREINVLQVGDMYELWNGLDRYWEEQTLGEAITPVLGRDWEGMSAWDFVRFWVLETNRAFPDLIRMLNSTGAHPRFFLHGNHDCYLKVGTFSPPIPTVPARQTLVHKGGIFIEHGQALDEYNRDGAKRGYLITQANFQLKNKLRNLEDPARKLIGSDKRKVFIGRAAGIFSGTTDFCVYVMGHTHSPYLTLVRLVKAGP